MNDQPEVDRPIMAEIAGGRAKMYDMFVGIFGHLPNQLLLSMIKGDDLQNILDDLCHLKNPKYQTGVDYIKSYRSLMQSKVKEEILNELSVDRTRMLRGTGPKNLKPPYEGLYKNDSEIGESALKVKSFYRKVGLLPAETVHESPDYLCIELDFMKNLCLREQDLWLSRDDAIGTVKIEEDFLKEHLGSWVGEFCSSAERYALTDFFRGFIMILHAFVVTDMDYLQNFHSKHKILRNNDSDAAGGR